MNFKPSCQIIQHLKKNKLFKPLVFATLFGTVLCCFIAYRNHINMQNQAMECWEKHFLKPNYHDKLPKMHYIPFTIEEAPVGLAPNVPVDFLIEEKSYCSKRPLLRVIVYVHSAIQSTEKREITRKTWASASKLIGVVFMVGRAKNDEELAIVKKESETYHDIVQGNYTDLYKLLVYKALNSLYWLVKNCEQVPWVVHADDDVIVDVFQLLGTVYLHDRDRRHNEVFCHPFIHSKTLREPHNKWPVNYQEYPCETYPPYCAGPAWFTSMTVIKILLKKVPLVKYLWIDDVFVTGFLVTKGGVELTEIPSGLTKVKSSEIGNVILWLNVESNRTVDWLNILNFYKRQNFFQIFRKE